MDVDAHPHSGKRRHQASFQSIATAVDLVRRGLGDRLDHHGVDVDVLRQCDDEADALCDVVGDERPIDAVVDLVGCRPVAVQTGERELLGAHHAGADVDDADVLAVELESQGLGDHGRAVLRRDVAGTALVDPLTGDRADVDDGRPGRLTQQRQHRLDHPQRADHVRGIHLLPLDRVTVLDPRHPERATGVVDDDVAAPERGPPPR